MTFIKRFLSTSKQKILLLALLLSIILGAVGYSVDGVVRERALNFQIYQPHHMPAGINITRYDISIDKGESGDTTKNVEYFTNTPDFYISEQKRAADQNLTLSYNCTDGLSNAKCTIYTSPRHQKYAVETVYTYDLSGKPFGETVTWLKGNTLIWITLDHDQIQKYTPQIWNEVIDSFTPINYPHAHIEHTRWKGI